MHVKKLLHKQQTERKVCLLRLRLGAAVGKKEEQEQQYVLHMSHDMKFPTM